VPGIWRGRDLKVRNVFDATDPVQAVFDDLNFRFQLSLIIYLLKVATAATTKVLARRFDALWGRRDYLLYLREGDVALHSID